SAEHDELAVEATFAEPGRRGVARAAAPDEDDARHQPSDDTRAWWSQPWRSGAAPRWMSTSSLRNRMLTSPGSPSPTVHDPRADLTAATGVMTAAVPHAKTSVREPSSQPARHSSTLIRPSSTLYPRSRATTNSQSRLIQ